jgi:hypothetical protein
METLTIKAQLIYTNHSLLLIVLGVLVAYNATVALMTLYTHITIGEDIASILADTLQFQLTSYLSLTYAIILFSIV